jgi:AcrR family transcriptional regulator
MPKGFTEQERAQIRATLLEQGRALFEAYGPRKTNVADLAQAAGISKGAFYLFFESKEMLFFELLEQFEANFRATLLKQIARTDLPPRQRMRELLHTALELWKNNSLFTHFSREEYEYLSRKLPPKVLQGHFGPDDAFAAQFIAAWERTGVRFNCEPRLLSGLMRGLFFIGLHEDEFDQTVYPQVIDVYTQLLSAYFVPAN